VAQDAPLAALHEGRIADAGHLTRTAPRLPATPHLSYVSRASHETYYGQVVENIQAFLAGAPARRLPDARLHPPPRRSPPDRTCVQNE
jgi:phosphoglycerate dehydrogenase-like enzyme